MIRSIQNILLYVFFFLPLSAHAQTEDLAARRSLIFPTAQTLPQGAWQHENYYLVLNNLYVGLHDRITLNAGYGFYPEGKQFKDDHFATVGLKWKFHERNHFCAAVGANIYKSFYGHTYDIGYLYMAAGNNYRKWHYNGKFGYLISREGFYIFNKNEKSTVVIGFDVQTRLSDRWILLGELAYLPKVHFSGIQHPLFFNPGVRYSAGRLTADLGMLNAIGTGSFIGFPVVSVVYRLY